MSHLGPAWNPFAVWFREAYRSANLTQEGAARELGVSLRTVQRWLGGVSIPDRETVKRIERGLGAPPAPEISQRPRGRSSELQDVRAELSSKLDELTDAMERLSSRVEALGAALAEIRLAVTQKRSAQVRARVQKEGQPARRTGS